MVRKLGTKVFNKRLGLKGKIVGYCNEPSFMVKDENGQEWSGGQFSDFYKEWETVL